MKRVKATCPKCSTNFSTTIQDKDLEKELRIFCPNCGAVLIKAGLRPGAQVPDRLEQPPNPNNQKENVVPHDETETCRDGLKRHGDFRTPKEKLALYFSLMCIGFFLFILLKINVYVFLIFVGISVALVKLRQGQFLGQAVKVGEKQTFEEVYGGAKLAAERLVMKMPDIFIRQDPVINAFAMGFLGRKSVVLNSRTVEAMTPNELICILGHEFSHIRCNHTNWIIIAGSADSIRIPILSDLLGLILMMWSRKAELTADRGALIASQNIKATMSALAKVAVGEHLFQKLNIEAFINQGGDIDRDYTARLGALLSTHPYLVRRLSALLSFSRSRKYNEIIKYGLESDLTANDIFGAVLEDAEKKRLKKEIKDLKDNISQLRNEKQFPDIEELPNKEKGTSHPITPQDRNKSGDLNKPRLHIDRRKARLTERSNYQEKSELRTMLASIDYKTMGVCLIILIIFCIVGSC